MRVTTAAAALGLWALGIALSAAASFSGALDELAAELVARRDGDFTGTLDRDQKKRLKAVLKSIGFLGKPADDLGDDLKAAGLVAKTLEKAFPEEFAAAVVGPTLGDLVDDALDSLEADLAELRTSIEDGLGALSGSALTKAQGLLDKAEAAREASLLASTRSARAKGLARAWKLLLKAKRIVDGAGGGGGEGMSATVDGDPWQALTWQCGLASSTGDMILLGTAGTYPAARMNIFLSLGGVDGADAYPLGGTSTNVQVYAADATHADFHTVATGTLTVTVFDPPDRIAGTFSLTTGIDPGVIVVTNGRFDIRAPEFSVSE